MPYSREWIWPDVFLEHQGVTIYHTYKHDEIEQGRNQYWFTPNALFGTDTGYEFDVRDLPLWKRVKEGENLNHRREVGEAEAIRKTLIDAIERGLFLPDADTDEHYLPEVHKARARA